MEFDADVQCTNYAGLLTSLPTVEAVLDDHASELGHDLLAYSEPRVPGRATAFGSLNSCSHNFYFVPAVNFQLREVPLSLRRSPVLAMTALRGTL